MSAVVELVVAVLIVSGAAFALTAAVGVLRFPDALMRMHAAAKAGTLGSGLLLLAVAVAEPSVAPKALLTVLFLCLTTPVAAHVLGRVAARQIDPATLLVDERQGPEA